MIEMNCVSGQGVDQLGRIGDFRGTHAQVEAEGPARQQTDAGDELLVEAIAGRRPEPCSTGAGP